MPETPAYSGQAIDLAAGLQCLAALLGEYDRLDLDPGGVAVLVGYLAREASTLVDQILGLRTQGAA
jgi:hypothetical protein